MFNILLKLFYILINLDNETAFFIMLNNTLPDYDSGKRVTGIVKASGLGRNGIAEAVGCSLGSINNWRNGTLPSKEFLWWAFTQGHSADYVLFGVDGSKTEIPDSLKAGMEVSDLIRRSSELPSQARVLLLKTIADQVYQDSLNAG